MTPYAMRVLPVDDIELWQRIRKTIEELPDPEPGNTELSCHMLVRAVSEVFGAKYQDGRFRKRFNHSWVVTNNNNIIDVYPVGILGGPILVDEYVARMASLYEAFSEEMIVKHYGEHFDSQQFKDAVANLTLSLKSRR
jgi:hypothetical protein